MAAVKAGQLVGTLSGPGPFTVFAPTNEAFAKLPRAVLVGLLRNRAALDKILEYHVVAGKVMSKDVAAGDVATVNGEMATIAVEEGVVTIDNARVSAVDIEGSNGVIHVIDTVILPEG